MWGRVSQAGPELLGRTVVIEKMQFVVSGVRHALLPSGHQYVVFEERTPDGGYRYYYPQSDAWIEVIG